MTDIQSVVELEFASFFSEETFLSNLQNLSADSCSGVAVQIFKPEVLPIKILQFFSQDVEVLQAFA